MNHLKAIRTRVSASIKDACFTHVLSKGTPAITLPTLEAHRLCKHKRTYTFLADGTSCGLRKDGAQGGEFFVSPLDPLKAKARPCAYNLRD